MTGSGPAGVAALLPALVLAAGLGIAGDCRGGGGGLPAPPSPGEGEGRGRPRPGEGPGDPIETLEVQILGSFPHAPDAFTQGLLFHDGHLYESTGRRGASSLRRVDPRTGAVLARRDLPPDLFGEGLALAWTAEGGRLIQLTWESGLALVWDLETLERVGEHRYGGQGWGLAAEPAGPDGTTPRLAMSDGTAYLTFRDPETFEATDRVRVTMGGRPLARLNELEWVGPHLWANVWGSTTIVRIDPATATVTGVAHLAELEALLPPQERAGIDVLNGIAHRPGDGADGGSFLVTGKLWPRLFEVAFEGRSGEG